MNEYVTTPQTKLYPLTLHCQQTSDGLFPATPVAGGTGQPFLAISPVSHERDGGG